MNSDDVFSCPTILTTSWEGTQHLENYNNAIHHKQWTIVISAKTIQPNCRFHPKLSKGNGKWRWMPWRQWKATPLTLFQGRSCKIKFIVAVCWGLDEESHLVFEMFEHWFVKLEVAFGRCQRAQVMSSGWLVNLFSWKEFAETSFLF